MDPHYAVAKFGLESKDILRSSQKGCWHYTKYVFIFLSIIQFLIILGLVLFMLYGNAHAGTEDRLKSVEKRYDNLNLDYLWLQGNFSTLKAKLSQVEKQHQNCTQVTMIQIRQMETMNRTIAFLKTQVSPDCRRLPMELYNLNMTCINERLWCQNYRFRIEAEFRQYKENCTTSVNDLTIKLQMAAAEKSRLLQENTDQRTQFRMYKDSCITIEEKFRNEMENMKKNLESNFKSSYDSYGTTYKCRVLSDLVSNTIDHTISRLGQDVKNVMLENSQMKVNQGRTSEDLRQCNEDKQGLTEERNKLVTEKTAIQNELTEKTNSLNKSYGQFMIKLEELENCRKMQFTRYQPSRP